MLFRSVVEHFSSDSGLDLYSRAEKADSPKKTSYYHRRDNEYHRQTYSVEQKGHIKCICDTVNIYDAMKKPINDRIRAACKLQGADRFKIMEHCQITIDAYASAVYDSKNLTADVRLDNGTSNIDTLDATEYAYEREIYDLCDAR